VSKNSLKILIAASGTGGHIFPALAVAEQLPDAYVEWLGVPDRLETKLVPESYCLHTIPVGGFQKGLSLSSLKTLFGLVGAIFKVKKILQQRQINLVFTTGGYIAGPTILAAKLAGIPVILHESNFIPGKVTRLFARFCQVVALGFEGTAKYLKGIKTMYVSTPVRSQFLSPQSLALPIPDDVPVIVVVGGSQGAVALNERVRLCVGNWLEAGAYVVHLTGEKDADNHSLEHPHYFNLPFYENMAALFQRANLAISRAGSGSLTELAVTKTPAILIPYPFAAEDHQSYNARVFADAGGAIVYRQGDLTPEMLNHRVLDLITNPDQLEAMSERMGSLAIADSATIIADLICKIA
jgi:UDP-N-acetylglucosamine--N-acetylmuramyl-(pentapeptide) pyrophosphoryl-undecaprenol N-acetylglucosamine transferase